MNVEKNSPANVEDTQCWPQPYLIKRGRPSISNIYRNNKDADTTEQGMYPDDFLRDTAKGKLTCTKKHLNT